jgi:hypothetical protein
MPVLTLRSDKESALTYDELDENFRYLKEYADLVSTAGSGFVNNINALDDGYSSVFIQQGTGASFPGFSIGLGVNSLANEVINAFSNNVAIGFNSLTTSTTGYENTAVGFSAGKWISTGNNNSAFGSEAMRYQGASHESIAIGHRALYGHPLYKETEPAYQTAHGNIAIGVKALTDLTEGSKNIGIGYTAGSDITTGSNNTIIGEYAGTTTLVDTLMIYTGTTERLRIDSTGFYVNGSTSSFTGGTGPTGPTGGTGPTGLITISGYVYYAIGQASAPSAPTATSYNISTGAFTGLTTDWSVDASITVNPDLKYWVSRYTGTESSSGSGSVTSITFGTPIQHLNFDGVVTFTNQSVIGSGDTTIDGSKITTGSITANQLNVNALNVGIINSIDISSDSGVPGQAFEIGTANNNLFGADNPWTSTIYAESSAPVSNIPILAYSKNNGCALAAATLTQRGDYPALSMMGAFVRHIGSFTGIRDGAYSRLQQITIGNAAGLSSSALNLRNGSEVNGTWTKFTTVSEGNSDTDTFLGGTVFWTVEQDLVRAYYRRSATIPPTPSKSDFSNTFSSTQTKFDYFVDSNTPIGAWESNTSGLSSASTYTGSNGWQLTDPGGSGDLYKVEVMWHNADIYGMGGLSAWNGTISSACSNLLPPEIISNALPLSYGGHTATKKGGCQSVLQYRDPGSGNMYAAVLLGDVSIQGSLYVATNATIGGTIYPFTGSHEGLIEKSVIPEEGDILIDNGVSHHKNISNTISEMELSSIPNQKGVVGIYTERAPINDIAFPEALGEKGVKFISNGVDVTDMPSITQTLNPDYEHYIDSHDACGFNSLGEGMMNVCGESGNLEVGDLIVSSSIPGKGMKQGDDIIKSYTVAKVRENVTFTDLEEVKSVACIYICG